MPALPSQIDFQQSNARSVSAGDLEVMGKKASAAWSSGDFDTLGEAVSETVKHAGLSPEQVRRVVEFANTDAFLEAFHKLGSGHRYVDFGQGVLADPRDVIRDMNDGGGGSVFDRGTADYDAPPKEKRAAAEPDSEAELALYAAFRKEASQDEPFENPSGWVWDVRDKLAGETQHLNATVSGLEVAYQDCALNLCEQVKHAARDGVELGQIVRAWSTVVDDPTYVKVAFQLVTPRLLRDGTYRDLDHVNQSIEKTGSARLVNPDHPLVDGFADYCEVLCKLAEVRQARDRMANKLAKVNFAIKKFGGDMDKVAGVVRQVIDSAGRIGHSLGGEGGELAAKGLLLGGTALGAKAGYDTITTDPTVVGVNARVNPLSSAYKQRRDIRRDMAMQQALGVGY
jgi:hypothetical protein